MHTPRSTGPLMEDIFSGSGSGSYGNFSGRDTFNCRSAVDVCDCMCLIGKSFTFGWLGGL